MRKLSRFCNILLSFSNLNKRTITDGVYVAIFSYLILYSVFNTLYIDKGAAGKPYQVDNYDVENVTFKLVDCLFPISSQYERTPRYICYLLLVFVVVIRNHEWLAAGAAASVLTYSGVAAIHMILLFAMNNKLNYPKAKSHCEFLPIPGPSPFVACAGVYEPDINLAMMVVSSVMLGALPVLAWSTTFRSYTNKAILISWLLLLAVGHSFYTLTATHPNLHFQICPENFIEPLPAANYQAPLLDQSCRESFYSLVLTAQNSSQDYSNGSSPVCIYSCFATAGYIGRKPQDIGVRFGDVGPLKSLNNRRNVIMFWWLYTLLAFLTLFTTEKKGWLPVWVHELLFSIECPQQPLASRWKMKSGTSIVRKGMTCSITSGSSEDNTSPRIHITVLNVVQFLTQLIAMVAFCGDILVMEIQNAQEWNSESQEPFAAVGQWGSLAVVLLILVAAGVSQVWAREGVKSAVVREQRLQDGTEELHNDEWDWHVGYAS